MYIQVIAEYSSSDGILLFRIDKYDLNSEIHLRAERKKCRNVFHSTSYKNDDTISSLG